MKHIIISFCGLLEIIDRFTKCSGAAVKNINQLPGTIDFHLLIRKSFCEAKFSSSEFEPNQIIRMVNNTHLIRFSIPNRYK